MKTIFRLVIVLGMVSGMISCDDDYAEVENNVIETEYADPNNGGESGNNGGGGGLPPNG